MSSLRTTVKGCDDLRKLIDEIPEGYGGEMGRVDSKVLKKFLSALENLPVGELSKAITTKDGIHGLMICSPVAKNTIEQLKSSVEGAV